MDLIVLLTVAILFMAADILSGDIADNTNIKSTKSTVLKGTSSVNGSDVKSH